MKRWVPAVVIALCTVAAVQPAARGVGAAASASVVRQASDARCGLEQQELTIAEGSFFATHQRFGSMHDLQFRDGEPVDYSVTLWPGALVYVVTPVKGRPCDLKLNADQKFAADAEALCRGVQQAVYSLETSVMHGEEPQYGMSPARSGEFYRRGLVLARALQKRLGSLRPPVEDAAQWRKAVKAFDGYTALLDDMARSRPTDVATTKTVYDRHAAASQQFRDVWDRLVKKLSGQLQACQYLSISPGAGE